MLTRIRIEVENEDNSEKCVEVLNRYEHAILEAEATRQLYAGQLDNEVHSSVVSRQHFEANSAHALNWCNEEIARSITDEVIERQKDGRYRGRRVVLYGSAAEAHEACVMVQ